MRNVGPLAGACQRHKNGSGGRFTALIGSNILVCHISGKYFEKKFVGVKLPTATIEQLIVVRPVIGVEESVLVTTGQPSFSITPVGLSGSVGN